MKQPCVYILASRPYGTLYIGVTTDLDRRLVEHRTGLTRGFVWKHKVFRLVYLEVFETVESAIRREKRLKEWRRHWKIRLIEGPNPRWEDLAPFE